MASHVRAALAVFSCLLATSMVRAGDMCPAPPKHKPAPATPIPAGDHRIRIDSDAASLDCRRLAVLTGHVQAHQDARSVAADSVTYDEKTGKLTVKGAVDFEDPRLRHTQRHRHLRCAGRRGFQRGQFPDLRPQWPRLCEGNGGPSGRQGRSGARCAIPPARWAIRIGCCRRPRSIWTPISRKGTAHGVVMRFKDVPIFYTPYLSFPLGDERKSGVLFPSFGHSGQQRLSARGALLFQSGAELRSDR